MNTYEKIGKKLQEAREEAQMSQGELAKKIGCSQASLSNYELGKRRLYLADLQRISEILGKPIIYFIEDTEGEIPVQEDLKTLLKDPYIREAVMAIRDLNLAQRKSVLDFILWQKNGSQGK